MAISNPCARLIANAIIFYNSAILSRLLTKYEASGNATGLALITQMSPAAWRHILLNGHYTFHSDGKMIDLDGARSGVGRTEFSAVPAYNPQMLEGIHRVVMMEGSIRKTFIEGLTTLP